MTGRFRRRGLTVPSDPSVIVYGPRYYVDPAGNDTTGNGSGSAPWQTLNKAIASVPLNIKCQILLAAGTYKENISSTHWLYIATARSEYVTIQPMPGLLPSQVIICGDNSSSNYCLRFDANASNYRFRNLTITPPVDISNSVIFFTDGGALSNLEFEGCVITIRGVAGQQRKAAYGEIATGSNSLQHVVFRDCTINDNGVGAEQTFGIDIRRDGAGQTVDDIQVIGGTITVTSVGIRLPGVTNLRVQNVVIAPCSSYAVIIGVDGETGITTTGSVVDNTSGSSAGHALLIGAGCSNMQVSGNTMTGGDYAMVLKECTGTTVRQNILNGGSSGPLLFKATTNPVVDDNTINATAIGSSGVTVVKNAVNNAKNDHITLTNNRINASSGANCMLWGDSSNDNGGGICDTNQYHVTGGGNLGTIRATAGITDLAGLQAAWSGYDVSGNDTHSTVV